MTGTIAEFDVAYCRAWETPEPLRPSQWAERYRVLSRRQSSRPGPWSNELSPVLVGVMDLAINPRVRKLSIQKAAQVGVSEALRNAVGYLADREPDPVLLNLPSEAHGRGIFADRIIPLFEDTPRLVELLSADGRDTTLSQITLTNGFTLRLGWSGSPTSQSSHPVRIVWNDETDKFAEWAGKESDPISLAGVRAVTYPNSAIISTSTPTTRDGPIHRLYDASPIKLTFTAPCPHCNAFAPITFDRIQWDKDFDEPDKNKRAASILSRGAAWYVCAGCGVVINECDRAATLNKGCWSNADGSYQLFVDGREHGELPNEAEIGMHIWAGHSLAAKHTFASIAAEFIKADGDPIKTQNFRNSFLGEVFEIQVATTVSNIIGEKAAQAPEPNIFPSWGAALFASADVQKNHFWWTIRAWGHAYRSQLLAYGIAATFDELYRDCLESSFPFEGRDGKTVPPHCLLIDSGGTASATDPEISRTNEVYQFALRDIGRIFPCKGASHKMQRPWTLSALPNGITLRILDTNYYKDFLHRLIHDPDPLKWQPHREINEDYVRQLCAEHKIFDRKKQKSIWTPRTSGAANHLFDAEVLQCAAADMANLGAMPPEAPAEQLPPRPPVRRPSWMPPKPENWLRR